MYGLMDPNKLMGVKWGVHYSLKNGKDELLTGCEVCKKSRGRAIWNNKNLKSGVRAIWNNAQLHQVFHLFGFDGLRHPAWVVFAFSKNTLH